VKILKSKIARQELTEKHLEYFKSMLKAVVDLEKEIIAIDAELHSDLEVLLLEEGSKQENLWGINLYPLKDKENFIEYTALINIRPHQNNYSMEIEDLQTKEKINKIVNKLIEYEF
jgi:hypothetical protein